MPDDWQTLHEIADRASPRLRRIILQAIRDTKNNVVLARIQRAIQEGNYFQAQRIIEDVWREVLQDAGPNLSREIRNIMEEAADIPRGLQIRFNVTNPEVFEWIRNHTGTLIREVDNNTILGVRQAIFDAFQSGGHPYKVARRIRGMIGLTRRQAQAVDRFRTALEERAFSDLSSEMERRVRRIRGVGLAREGQIDELVAKYQERLIRERAENIARTETIAASAQGQNQLWQQNIGNLQGMEVKWLVTPDDRSCELCRAQAANYPTRPINGVYGNGQGPPPLHPRCRCAERLVRAESVAA